MRLSIAAIGRMKSGAERELFGRYHDRLAGIARTVGLEKPHLFEINESLARRPEERMADEAKMLLETTQDSAFLIVLDERGKHLSSADFSAAIGRQRDNGRSGVSFIIGGADGLHEDVRARADLLISFGAMTIPHQLVRVLLMEQLYRAATILSGHPYHRA